MRQWLASVVPPGERVVGLRPMAGATSSAMHAVTTEDAHGVRRRLVLRRYVNRAWLAGRASETSSCTNSPAVFGVVNSALCGTYWQGQATHSDLLFGLLGVVPYVFSGKS